MVNNPRFTLGTIERLAGSTTAENLRVDPQESKRIVNRLQDTLHPFDKVRQRMEAAECGARPICFEGGLSDLSGFVSLEEPGEVLFVRRFFLYHLRRHRQMPRTAMTPQLRPLLDSVSAAVKRRIGSLPWRWPDICASIEGPKKKVGPRYSKWWENRFGRSYAYEVPNEDGTRH
jgi:hypothetical protein